MIKTNRRVLARGIAQELSSEDIDAASGACPTPDDPYATGINGHIFDTIIPGTYGQVEHF